MVTTRFEQHLLMVPCTKYSMGSLQPVLLFTGKGTVEGLLPFRDEPSPITFETLSTWIIGSALGNLSPMVTCGT